MTNTGLPLEDVDAVRDAITDMWTDAPGGWVYEWSKLTASYAEADSHQQAALAYGWAKFPTLADEPKRVAHAMQLEQYLLAAPGFGLDFRREVLDLPYRDATTKVPVHLFAPLDLADDTPVVLISGGCRLLDDGRTHRLCGARHAAAGAGAGLRHRRNR